MDIVFLFVPLSLLLLRFLTKYLPTLFFGRYLWFIYTTWITGNRSKHPGQRGRLHQRSGHVQCAMRQQGPDTVGQVRATGNRAAACGRVWCGKIRALVIAGYFGIHHWNPGKTNLFFVRCILSKLMGLWDLHLQ